MSTTIQGVQKVSDVDPDPDLFGSVDPDSESGSGSIGLKSLITCREKQSLTNQKNFFTQEIIFFKSEHEKVGSE